MYFYKIKKKKLFFAKDYGPLFQQEIKLPPQPTAPP